MTPLDAGRVRAASWIFFMSAFRSRRELIDRLLGLLARVGIGQAEALRGRR